jgi:RNA chaperone Hfq
MKQKTVAVTLMTGEVIKGTLSEVWQYEIIIDAEGSQVVILKHAIATMVHELP